MPLEVSEHWPSRKALLLFGSSHDSVPGTKVSYIAFAYSRPLTVSFEAIVTRFFSSTSLPPCDQITQWHQVFASPVAWPSAKPAGVFFDFRAWQSLRKPSVSFGTLSKPAAWMWLLRCTSAPPEAPIGSAIHLPFRMP